MKAIVYKEYGSPDVLQLMEVEKPAPKDDEVLVKVYAVSVNAADLHLLRVEAVGKDVKQFQPGDEVFGDISGSGWGGFAEYASASEGALVIKPANLTFEQASAVPMAAVTALQGLKKGMIQPGQKVLVVGASGGVGTFAVQIAKSFGAEVTAVCSTKKMEMVRSIGADHVIDYTQEDFAKNGLQYDLILAANGDRSISDYRRVLAPKGTYVMSGGSMAQMMQAMLLGPWYSKAGEQKMGNLLAKPNKQDLTFIKDLLEARKVTPVIDRCYPLRETAEAVRYLEEGHAMGKVVITIAEL